jgi:hypothetical protein
MTNATDFYKIMDEAWGAADGTATTTSMGSSIAKQEPVKLGKKTPVHTAPETKPDQPVQQTEKPSFPQQPQPGPAVPTFRQQLDASDLLLSTRRAMQRQSGRYTNRKT